MKFNGTRFMLFTKHWSAPTGYLPCKLPPSSILVWVANVQERGQQMSRGGKMVQGVIVQGVNVHLPNMTITIKLCPRGAQICAHHFCCCSLDPGPMTFKLDRDIDILKLYLCTENEYARSSHTKVTV